MQKVLSSLLLLLCSFIATAQTRQVTGKVSDEADNSGIVAATVKVKGSSTGTSTNAEGVFSLMIPSGNVVLQISSTGYSTKEVPVEADQTEITVSLAQNTDQLSEVVVTALGISKEQKKLGYSVTKVDADLMNKAREVNVANALSGRVAGLKVNATSSGPGGTAKTLLRGLPSMNSAGSPLYVINGIPIDNTQRGASGEWGGSDNGDGIGNINPDDIETMTVLKGQSASALYGARATNGVILITTKSGRRNTSSVEFNTNLMADRAIDFTDFQYEYGQGQQGLKPTDENQALLSNRMSWGAKMDGSDVIGFDGKTYSYSPVTDNINSFYRTGTSFTNTLSFTNGGENGSFRLSLSNLDNNSIIRNSGLDRKTINFSGEQKITKGLSANVLINYIDEKSKARPQLSDGPMNANNFQFLATNVSHEIFQPGYDTATGFETVFSDDIYVTNPWFVVNQYKNDLTRKRWITTGSLKYDFTDWLYAQARVGYDLSNDRLFKVEPWGTAYTQDQHGNLQDLAQSQQFELNVDGMIGATRDITQDLNLNVVVGANHRKNEYEKTAVAGGYFLIPYVYTLSNTKNPRTNPGDNYRFWRTRVNSAYYSVDFAFRDYLTLSTTGRYDAYSTMPTDANTIFTPSVSAAFIFSDLVPVPNLNFGKLRASYAQTSGELSEAYKTALYYTLGSPLGGIPLGNFSTDLPNGFLKPFVTTELEIGTELNFLNNRLNFDVAWYTKKTKNEVMPATFSPATGATTGFVGTGSTQNKGVEVLITGTPVKQNNFSWVTSVNFTTISNKILETDTDGKNLNLGQNRGTLGNAVTAYVKGLPGPQILAFDYARDDKGQIIVDGGLPVRGELIPMGSVLPKTYGGWNNEFNFGSLNFAFLFDFNYGNKILSATKYYAIRRGLDKMTLEGRGGITTGVLADGTPNTTTVSAQDYYTALSNNVTAHSVLDGDFIKLRQVTLGYTFNEKALSALKIFSSINISLVGRNLAVLMKKSDNIDPEANFASNVKYFGIEGTSLPSVRSFGVNVNFKFKK